jgi:hypothetical protein
VTKLDLEGALVATSVTLGEDVDAGRHGLRLAIHLDLILRGSAAQELAHPVREAFLSRIAVGVDDIQMRQLLSLLGIAIPEGV